MGKLLRKYEKIVGKETVAKILKEARTLKNKKILHISSSNSAGGVARVLMSLIPLMNDVGIKTNWYALKAPRSFFMTTKNIHNALQGENVKTKQINKKFYLKFNKTNAALLDISQYDAIIVHDPQPLPIINFYKKKVPWIWRCHIDISSPNKKIFRSLKSFISKYDQMIVSMPQYTQDIKVPQAVIPPAIDPLDPKNTPLRKEEMKQILNKAGIKLDKPLLVQVSRFDKWKDPLGVIEVFKKIKKEIDCRLVLVGELAGDDPEGDALLAKVRKTAKKVKDVYVISPASDALINALQTAAAVVLQKSLKEGFGLTVSEALWKRIPVVGTNVGGIASQIISGRSGYIVNDKKECVDKVITLLQNPKMAAKMGRSGREYVKEKFLITRSLLDYITIIKKVQ